MPRNTGTSALPPDPIYGLTWTIPKDFGGLTNVLLHRSSAFARLDGRRIDILTLAADLDVSRTSLELRESGLVGENVRIRNLWTELAALTNRKLAKAFAAKGQALDEPGILLPYEGATTAKRLDADGTELQVDYFRSDGTRMISDRRDVKRPGTLGGRQLTLFSRKGAPLNQWTRASDLYFAWLDHVIGSSPAFLINDSHFVGGFLHKYRRSNVTTAQVIHNSHLDPESVDSFGRLTRGKFDVVKGLGSYDLVAPLTIRQAEEIREANLAGPRMIPIPNSRNFEDQESRDVRDAADGIMLARLSGQKRVRHAVSAFDLANAAGSEARLRIYGDGDDRTKLQQQIDDADASSYVSLMGFSPDASKQFATASFSVLSSRFEGMPLVLIESMAAGCIPVAYDIRYGPSDIITHGVNGFLVPAGDVKALADTIAQVAALPGEDLLELRRNGRKRAAEFSDEAVTDAWGNALTRARGWKRPDRIPKGRVELGKLSFEDEGLLVEGRVVGGRHLDQSSAFLSWSGRRLPVYGRVPAVIRASSDSQLDFEARWPIERSLVAGGDVLDLHIEIEGSSGFARLRLSAADPLEAAPFGNLEPYTTNKGNLSFRVFDG